MQSLGLGTREHAHARINTDAHEAGETTRMMSRERSDEPIPCKDLKSEWTVARWSPPRAEPGICPEEMKRAAYHEFVRCYL